ncbi:hypothetical protein Dda_2598 [Drechslerella dactyloides]|uniref:Glycosyl transferase CAP10 domain-containing protein n=1 Tax=Drechslerella dactyloides TaxID=74499 RepID=A0AAD6J1B0_DREDA|nr:hypothetical protein Dda_2598 [Drechslerella dactyloides]
MCRFESSLRLPRGQPSTSTFRHILYMLALYIYLRMNRDPNMPQYRTIGGPRRPFFLRVVFIEAFLAAIGLVAVIRFILGYSSDPFAVTATKSNAVYPSSLHGESEAGQNWGRRSLFLTSKQCRKEYPLLFKPIDEGVERGEFEFHRGPDDYTAFVSARIKNNKHRSAALHQIHKALVTSPEPLPDTVFSFTPVDHPKNNSWGYSKWYDHTAPLNFWPVPHFGHWSWPVKYVGPLHEAFDAVSAIEADLPFDSKTDKLFWRGTIYFNPIQNANLRANLITATSNKEWADIDSLQWTALEKSKNIIQIPEICRYKYIAYTEGISYSGRLPFHMLCESIIITPPINYLMHSTHLIKPLHAWTLGFKSTKPMTAWGVKRMQKAWPVTEGYGASEANAIFVSPDWSDLEETILWLRRNPKIARGIARRQKELYVEKGYLSEGAEMCYWRELIRGWNKVAIPTGDGWDQLGTPWETYVLRGSTDWN